MSNGEKSLYPDILRWLGEYLQNKHAKSKVMVDDVHSVYLSDFMQGKKLYHPHFPDYSTYRIKVDLLGTVIEKDKLMLTFVEVKVGQLNLRDVSQLLGYCKVLKPESAFLVSPKGVGSALNRFLVHYNRLDILEFEKNKFMHVAKWDRDKNAIDNGTMIPHFRHS